MATIFSHALAATTLAYLCPLQQKSKTVYLTAAVCAVIPDADVAAFRLGIAYADFWGHRGFTHSVTFAVLCGFVATILTGQRLQQKTGLFYASLYTAATFSHGLLDAFTNGGLGVALFSPFYNERIFFAVRPIAVSPIGVRFFTAQGLTVLASEALWIGLPCTWIVVVTLVYRRFKLLHD